MLMSVEMVTKDSETPAPSSLKGTTVIEVLMRDCLLERVGEGNHLWEELRSCYP
jgi:hypothetical protein